MPRKDRTAILPEDRIQDDRVVLLLVEKYRRKNETLSDTAVRMMTRSALRASDYNYPVAAARLGWTPEFLLYYLSLNRLDARGYCLDGRK